MERIWVGFWMAILLVGCTQESNLTVKGVITGAEKGQMIYLDSEALEGTVVLDSAKIDENGKFSMRAKLPVYPEFYRLRLGNGGLQGDETVHLCVDSSAVITINGSLPGLAKNYTIEGSRSSQQLREIIQKQMALEGLIAQLVREAKSGMLPIVEASDSIRNEVLRYQDDMRLNYIYADPREPTAYYALFQQISGTLLFDVHDERDVKVYQAVATCWDTFYPHSPRAENLHNYVIKGLRDQRILQARRDWQVSADKIEESGIVEINLPDRNGQERSLAALKGKVVVLDFCLQADQNASTHNVFLMDLYAKYQKRGFEIYQVSVDEDEHYWRTAVHTLPWISVRESQVMPVPATRLYNVQLLPTMFLISKDGDLLSRHETHESLIRALEKQW